MGFGTLGTGKGVAKGCCFVKFIKDFYIKRKPFYVFVNVFNIYFLEKCLFRVFLVKLRKNQCNRFVFLRKKKSFTKVHLLLLYITIFLILVLIEEKNNLFVTVRENVSKILVEKMHLWSFYYFYYFLLFTIFFFIFQFEEKKYI